MMNFAMLMEALNIIILIFLLHIYTQNYKHIKAKFSLGLVFFASFFLLESMLALYFNITMMDFYAALELPTLVLHTLKTAGLIVLLFITWRS